MFPALKSSLYDNREFPNPEQFDVGHFLDKKGALRKSEFFIPFSTGKDILILELKSREKIMLMLMLFLDQLSILLTFFLKQK